MSLNICDWAYVLEAGRLVLSGSREEMTSNPRVAEACLGRKPSCSDLMNRRPNSVHDNKLEQFAILVGTPAMLRQVGPVGRACIASPWKCCLCLSIRIMWAARAAVLIFCLA
jgi:hypothetical protein